MDIYYVLLLSIPTTLIHIIISTFVLCLLLKVAFPKALSMSLLSCTMAIVLVSFVSNYGLTSIVNILIKSMPDQTFQLVSDFLSFITFYVIGTLIQFGIIALYWRYSWRILWQPFIVMLLFSYCIDGLFSPYIVSWTSHVLMNGILS